METVERQDPVVYGTHPGPLTAEQIDFYDKNGFLVLPAYFNADEVARYRDEALRAAVALAATERPEVVREPGGEIVRSVFAIHTLNETFGTLCRTPRLADAARQILGGDVAIHQSRINFKPGFHGKEFSWHSDFETWHVEDGMPRMRAVSCSVILSENNEFNGPLMLVPGSHRTYLTCVGKTPKDHYKLSLRKQEYGVPSDEALKELVDRGGLESFKGPAGSVLFFDCNTMHGSGSNISPFPRNNVFFVYNSVENALVEPFGGTEPRPEFIAHRNAEPLG
ncbi:MAG: ectoine hydroxylase [Deltaproteobacteria bacterium]|nr:ectoine hydroxylase [Deltaproteobacteria bacterium]